MGYLVSSVRPNYICSRCLSNFLRQPSRTSRASFSSTSSLEAPGAVTATPSGIRLHDYFLANAYKSANQDTKKSRPSKPAKALGLARWLGYSSDIHGSRVLYFEQNPEQRSRSPRSDEEPKAQWLRDQRPKRRKATLAVAGPNEEIPPDASSRLSTLSTKLPAQSLRRLLSVYLSLAKPRLSFLIVLTTTTAYSLCPVPAILLPSSTTSPSLSALTLLFLTTGTALSSASANALNMLFEPEHDAKMSRTRNRPLVRGLVTPRATAVFAALVGAAGVGLLYVGVNPTVAALGGINIFLYAAVYTPMKRLSVFNTWVGALVGAIPPLMGWAAAAGQSANASGDWKELLLSPESVGGWLLASLLFAWQFPHFNALSWSIREEYKHAGYRMLAWVNPKANARVSLRYAVLLFPICVGLWWVGVTDSGFLVSSSVVNAWLVREAWRFWRRQGQQGSARALFWASVWHLPVVMVLAMLHKKGLWEGLWKAAAHDEGDEEEDEDEDEEHDDDDDGEEDDDGKIYAGRAALGSRAG